MFTAIWHRTRMPHTLNNTQTKHHQPMIIWISPQHQPTEFLFVSDFYHCGIYCWVSASYISRINFLKLAIKGNLPLPIQNSRWFVAASCYRVSEADMGKTTMSHMLGGVWGGNPQFLRFRVCRIRDETFTQQSRSVGGQCFTTFFPPDFFLGMLEESRVVMGKVEFVIERVPK